MATYVPAKVSTQYIFYASLVSQANTKLMQVNPTLASGDFKVSIDGGALANLGTLPTVTPAGGTMVKFTLSTSEMAGANATVVCIDASGSEWCDLVINIPTATRQIDDLAYPATSGRSMVVDASGLVDANAVKMGPTGSGTAQTARDIGASVLLSTGTGTGQLDFTSGVVKANVTQFGGSNITSTGGRPEVNTTHIAGSAVSTSTAQIGVNVVNAGATAWNSGSITASTFAANAIGSTTLADGTIDRATFAADTGLQTIRSGTAQAGASGTITLDASASSTTDYYKGATVYLTNSTGVGQHRIITAYNGSTKVAVIATAWATTPDNTTSFAILPQGASDIQSIDGSDLATATAGSIPADIRQINGSSVSTSTAQLGVNVVTINANAVNASALASDAVTEIQNGLSTLDAAGVRTAVGMASANLDTQLSNIYGLDQTINDSVAYISIIAEYIETTLESDGGSGHQFTTLALENAPADIRQISGSTTAADDLEAIILQGFFPAQISGEGISEGSFSTTAGSFDPLGIIDQGTAQSATSTTLRLRAAAAFADDELNGSMIVITGGTTGVGQSRTITDYTGSTDTATVAAWTTTPSGTITYKVFASTSAASGSAPTVGEIDTQLSSTHGAGLWTSSGSGSGAFPITVTVTDGSSPLQNALVRVAEGINAYTVVTDASGNGTFSLDAATYTTSVSKSGYSFTPTTRTVTGSQAGTLVNTLAMTQIVPSPSPDPNKCRVSGYLLDAGGDPAPGVKLVCTLTAADPAEADSGVVTIKVEEVTSNGDGYFQVDLLRTDAVTPASGSVTWAFTTPTVSITGKTLTTSSKDFVDLL